MLFSKDKIGIIRLFSKYLAKEIIQQVGEGDAIQEDLQKVDIVYMVIQVRDDPIDNVPAIISKVVQIIIDNGGIVTTICSSLIVATFCFSIDNKIDGLDSCNKAVRLLLDCIGDNIKIVYGIKDGLYGNLGSPIRMQYGPLIPSIASDLEALFMLHFGESKQMTISA